MVERVASGTSSLSFSALVCADWSKKPDKRVAFLAEVPARRIRVLDAKPTFEGMLAAARSAAPHGSVLLGFDVPLGVPLSFLRHKSFLATTFRDLLRHHGGDAAFFSESRSAMTWSPEKPFFAVPAGRGALAAFSHAARKFNVSLLRDIEAATGGKSLFITSGIPGSVGSSVSTLWPEIAAASLRHAFSLWPFDGSLDELSSRPGVVVGEVYPRAAYATALLDGSVQQRPQMSLAKTNEPMRQVALARLKEMRWVLEHRVVLEDTEIAGRSEDHFDALLTAAALLRCHLEELPFHCQIANPLVEGGILATGSVNLNLASTTFNASRGKQAAVAGRRQRVSTTRRGSSRSCPILNCPKTFGGSRGGWDSHVASRARHPDWHPTVTDGASRKALFRAEFPSFFE